MNILLVGDPHFKIKNPIETEKFDYFGLSLVCIDSTKYSSITKSVLNALNKNNWSLKEEFKSTCIFSSSNGDLKVDIETRKSIAEAIIKSNISKKNAKLNVVGAKIH